LRESLRDSFQKASIFEGKYVFHEVLKAIPSGDESIIEIRRKTREATEQKGLLEVEGENREIEASHDLKIARQQASLDEEMAQHKHDREKEIRELEARSEIMKTAISTLGVVASSGIDPTKLAKDVVGTLVDRVQQAQFASASNPGLLGNQKALPATEINQLEVEKQALESVKESVGIITYEILESQSLVKGAIVRMKDYEIIFQCGDNYPQGEPEATVRFPDNTTQTIDRYWIPGVSNSLAQAILAIVPQIHASDE
jgi:hypothetical protein